MNKTNKISNKIPQIFDLKPTLSGFKFSLINLIFNINIVFIFSKAAKKINILSQDVEIAENELTTLKRLNSDYIVKYLGFYSDSNFYYIITKYYEVCILNKIYNFLS